MLRPKSGRNTDHCEHGHRGFSMLELMIVVVVGIILTVMAIPTFRTVQQNMRTGGDASDLNGEVALTKMRAAADFTKARFYADLSAQTSHIETWNKSGGSWTSGVSEGGTQYLSQGVTWGYGS